MSRIGKKIITIPAGVEVTFAEEILKVKGPKGELVRHMDFRINVVVEDNTVKVALRKANDSLSALWGTYASHVSNMIEGVTTGFVKKLQIEGIGFKGEVKGSEIILNLGFSHQIFVKIPTGLTVTIEKGMITISGIDKEALGAFAASVRDFKKPEPYKGKGIRYEGERILMKQGKKSA